MFVFRRQATSLTIRANSIFRKILSSWVDRASWCSTEHRSYNTSRESRKNEMSRMFLPNTSLMEDGGGEPTDSTGRSYQLMIKAGLIRRSSSGIYTLLPMAYRVLNSIESIVDEELRSIDAFRIRMPSLLSSDLWKQTGRWEKTGVELFRLKDRRGTDFCLSPTHEEEVTHLVNHEMRSYKNLPIRLYQISWKYRDEARPRCGLMRCREFLMKDLYTFDRSHEEALKTYETICRLYERIFHRLSLRCLLSEADTGTIGGKLSHEFQAIANIGEDTVLVCSCGYATNHEKSANLQCPRCQNSLQLSKGIELGHAFLLGDIYSTQLKATFMDQQGHKVPYYMGCYGLGITRMLAALVEIHADEHGIRWPDSVAPYSICIVYSPDVETLSKAASHAYELLDRVPSLHDRILLDDRDLSLGYKLNESRFMGYPYTLVLGKNFIESERIEVIHRWTGLRKFVYLKELTNVFTQVDDEKML